VRFLIPLLGVTVLCGSCARPQLVTNHREAWRKVAPRSYEFDFSWHCFCAGAGAWWHVIVEDDRVISATLIDPFVVPKGGPTPPPGGFPTIDSVFAQIDRARAAKAASVVVSYDQALHYPLTVAIDRERDTIDDEWAMQIRNFRVRRGSG
jgi:hypothetical protein